MCTKFISEMAHIPTKISVDFIITCPKHQRELKTIYVLCFLRHMRGTRYELHSTRAVHSKMKRGWGWRKNG